MRQSFIFTVLVALTMTLTFANSNSISAQSPDEQYWRAVENSQKAEDFESYIKDNPGGKYISEARYKIGLIRGKSTSSNVPPTSAGQTDLQFLNSWAAETRSRMPATSGILELKAAFSRCPSGCEKDFPDTYLAIEARMPRHTVAQMPPQTMFDYLDKQFGADYCQSGASKRNIIVRFIVDDMNGVRAANSGIESTYCKNVNPSASVQGAFLSKPGGVFSMDPKVRLLNEWAAEVRVGLPEAIGEFQLTNANSQCPAGCEEELDPGMGNELKLVFTAPGFQSGVDTIEQIKPLLTPQLLPEYCTSEGMKNGIVLVIFVLDGNGRQINNYFIRPGDCAGRGGIVFE